MINPIVERIFMLMEKHNISAATLTREISLSNGLLTQWKQGKQIPSLEAVVKITNYFNVSIDYLVTGKEFSLPEADQKILIAYHSVDEATKKCVDKLLLI